MSITQMSNEQATRSPAAGMVDLKLDVVVHPQPQFFSEDVRAGFRSLR